MRKKSTWLSGLLLHRKSSENGSKSRSRFVRVIPNLQVTLGSKEKRDSPDFDLNNHEWCHVSSSQTKEVFFIVSKPESWQSKELFVVTGERRWHFCLFGYTLMIDIYYRRGRDLPERIPFFEQPIILQMLTFPKDLFAAEAILMGEIVPQQTSLHYNLRAATSSILVSKHSISLPKITLLSYTYAIYPFCCSPDFSLLIRQFRNVAHHPYSQSSRLASIARCIGSLYFALFSFTFSVFPIIEQSVERNVFG